MKPLPLLTFIAIASIGTMNCRAEPPAPAIADGETVVLPSMGISERTERRIIYEAKLEDMWSQARKTKTVRYVDAILIAYDTSKFDLMACLFEKKNYRDTIAKDHVFFCNYAAVGVEVPIHWTFASKGVGFSQALKVNAGTADAGAGYDFKTGAITLSYDAPVPALLHASGASLAAHPSARAFERMKTLRANNEQAELAAKIRFELQLQDFNRYFATFTGRPISSPLDAVRGLAMFGHKARKAQVKAALERYPSLEYTDAQIDEALQTAPVKRDGRTGIFEHAYRLVDGVSALGREVYSVSEGETVSEDVTVEIEAGLNQKNSKEYLELLARILIEAPGHI